MKLQNNYILTFHGVIITSYIHFCILVSDYKNIFIKFKLELVFLRVFLSCFYKLY